jgi:hypothetical protein
MQCNNCGSPDLVRLALLWERGTVVTTGSAYIGGLATGGVGGAYARTQTVSRSASANRAAPPVKRSSTGWVIVVTIVALPLLLQLSSASRYGFFYVLPIVLTFGIVAGFPIWRIRAIAKYNSQVWPRLMKEWGQRYQCNRCGGIGMPTNTNVQIRNLSKSALPQS